MTNNTTPELTDPLATLVSTSIAAGALILKIRENLDGWEEKADGSPVTMADRGAEDLIVSTLAKLDPTTPVMAEERISSGETTPAASQRFYLVDALDGTREFIKKRDEFTVNIALIEAGEPVMGVVVAPALGEGFAADASGAFRFRVVAGAATRIEAITARAPSSSITILSSLSHMTLETEDYLQQFDVSERLSYGSSLKFCRLAEGIADLYPRLSRTMEWDIAAGDAILRRAGGSVRTLDGAPMRYGKVINPDDVAFANPHFVAFGNWPAERLP